MPKEYDSFLNQRPKNRADVIYEYAQRGIREQRAYDQKLISDNRPSKCKTFLGFGCGFKGFAETVSNAANGFIRGGQGGAILGALSSPSEYERERAQVGGMSNDGNGGLFSGTVDIGAIFGGNRKIGTPPFVPTQKTQSTQKTGGYRF